MNSHRDETVEFAFPTPEERGRVEDELTEYLLNHHRGIEWAAEVIRRLARKHRNRLAASGATA